MARYAGHLLAPAASFGLWPRFFLPFGEKKACCAVFAHFRPFFSWLYLRDLHGVIEKTGFAKELDGVALWHLFLNQRYILTKY